MALPLIHNKASSPVGSVIAYAGKVSPEIEKFGWLVCDGSRLSITVYPELFEAIGYMYSQDKGLEEGIDANSDNDNYFRIPDFQSSFVKIVNNKPTNISIPCIIKYTYL